MKAKKKHGAVERSFYESIPYKYTRLRRMNLNELEKLLEKNALEQKQVRDLIEYARDLEEENDHLQTRLSEAETEIDCLHAEMTENE